MQRHQFLDERQTDARALVGPRRRILRLVETVEDVPQLFGGDPHARVFDDGLGPRGCDLHADRHPPARVGELQCVREQVGEHFLELLGIEPDLTRRHVGVK